MPHPESNAPARQTEYAALEPNPAPVGSSDQTKMSTVGRTLKDKNTANIKVLQFRSLLSSR